MSFQKIKFFCWIPQTPGFLLLLICAKYLSKEKNPKTNKLGLVFLLWDQKQSDRKVIYLLLILIDTNPLAHTLNCGDITDIIKMCPIL